MIVHFMNLLESIWQGHCEPRGTWSDDIVCGRCFAVRHAGVVGPGLVRLDVVLDPDVKSLPGNN